MKPKILIVDDEKPLRDTLARWFRTSYECLVAPDADEAMKIVAANPDLALMITDVRMPGEDGVSLMRKAKAANPDMGTIVLTAYGTVDLAVEAMRDGADDFFQKPITDLPAFELRVAKAVRNAEVAHGAAGATTSSAPPSAGLADFTGESPAMERVYRLIRKVAPTDATVIIEGPSGTGKELAARALHGLSKRADGPFVAVECSALAKDLLESELFGYMPGAFTGASAQGRVGHVEAAHGGTLFLDEIGEIDLSTQVKLLRVLESRTVKRVGGTEDIPVDFRLVAATNRNLAQMVAKGTFREDLYYRLNVIDIRMPALKDHPEDIPALANKFLAEFAKKDDSDVTGFAPAAMQALCSYAWPGNVRQLRNVVEKMVVLGSSPELAVADLPPEVTSPPPAIAPATPAAAADASAADARPAAGQSLADAERNQIKAALDACRGNKTKAAELLGISRRTLHRRLREWGVQT